MASVKPANLTELKNIVFDYKGRLQEIDISLLTSLRGLFHGSDSSGRSLYNWNTEDWAGIDTWDTSNITDMGYMFYSCYNFNQPIGVWDTSKVTAMDEMFYDCRIFNQPLNDWNVGKVTTMYQMFMRCYQFNQDLNNWDVSSVTTMEEMFEWCSAFNGSVDGWQCNSLTKSRYMFQGCSNYNQPMNNCRFPVLNDASYMFKGCTSFNQDLDQWDVSSIVTANSMFYQCRVFNGNITTWNLTNLVYANQMFYQCGYFNQDISNWRLPAIKYMNEMFFSCIKLNQNLDSWNISPSVSQTNAFIGTMTDPVWYNVFIPTTKTELINKLSSYIGKLYKIKTHLLTDLSAVFRDNTWTSESNFNGIETWDVSKVTNMSDMFNNCANFNKNIDGWDVRRLRNMDRMFYKNKKFNQPLNSWDTASLTSCSYAFAESVFNQPINNWNMTKVTNMEYMFYFAEFNNDIDGWVLSSCTSLREVFRKSKFNQPLNNWDVSNITNFQATFLDNIVFNQPLDNWNVSKGTNFSSLFKGATSFNQPLNSWDTASLTNLYQTFYGATSFNQDLNNWNVSKVNTLYRTFYNCTNFNGDISTWDVSLVTTLQETFFNCVNFNCDISNWNMKSMYNLQSTFEGCTSFNQPIGKWIFGRYLNYVDRMLYGCTSWFHSLDNWAGTSTGVTNGTTKVNTFFNTKKDVKAIWFDNYYYPDNIDDLSSDVILCKANLSKIKTMMVTDMSNLFSIRVPGATRWVNTDWAGIDTWDTSLVENISGMFKGCTNFNQPLASWNTENVRTINSFAEDCTSFNKNLDFWNYYNMEDRSASTKAFLNCPTQPVWYGVYTPKSKDELIGLVGDKTIPLNKIDTRYITDMSNVFQNSDRTNDEFFGINTWNMTNVTNIDYMFDGAINFNQNISSWNTVNIESAIATFRNCSNYNQPINVWNTSSMTNTELMFYNCSLYNQPMDAWNTTKLENISNMFNGCLSLDQNFDGWDTRTITDMDNSFEQVVQQPWWYGFNFEGDVVSNSNTVFDFSTLYPLTAAKQLSITSDSPDLNITRQYGNAFDFYSVDLGLYNPTVECNGGLRNIRINVVNPDINHSEELVTRYFKTLDFSQIYPTINVRSISLTNETQGLTFEEVTASEYRFKADSDGEFTVDITVNNVYTGVLTFTSSRLINDFSIETKTDKTIRKNFNTDYPGYDVSSITIVSNDSNLVVDKISDGIFDFTTLSNGTFTATIDLLGLDNTITVISDKALSDIIEEGKATLKQEIDIRNFITDVDYSKITISSSNTNFIVRKVSDIIYELLGLVSGSFTAEIRLENEVSTLTYNVSKLLQNEVRELSSNKVYDFDFNQLFPNSVLNSVTFTSPDPDLTITEVSNNSFTLEAQTVGKFTVVISINGDESNLVLNIVKYIKDETFMVYNKTFTVDFSTRYPGLNPASITVFPTVPNHNLKITKLNDEKYSFTFYKKGSYSVSIQLGKVVSIYKFKVFFVDSSNIDIYQYPESFISDLIKTQLYDPNLYVYQYNQYGEIEWVNKIFNYVNDKISKTINYVYLWYVLKTNQDLTNLDMSFINDKNVYLYINFLERNFDSIYKSFGNPGAVIFWNTPPSKWNDGKTKWDETVKTSDMSVNKFKSILRFIKDISNNSFNINRFIQFCYEFINCDKNKTDTINNVFVDDTSFDTPEDIIIYVDTIDENTNLLTTVLRSAYKHIMPMYNFNIRQKIQP